MAITWRDNLSQLWPPKKSVWTGQLYFKPRNWLWFPVYLLSSKKDSFIGTFCITVGTNWWCLSSNHTHQFFLSINVCNTDQIRGPTFNLLSLSHFNSQSTIIWVPTWYINSCLPTTLYPPLDDNSTLLLFFCIESGTKGSKYCHHPESTLYMLIITCVLLNEQYLECMVITFQVCCL